MLWESLFDKDDGDETIDETAHEKLLNSLFALDGKKRNKNEVRGISTPSGNLDLVVHAKKNESKIKPQDLKLKSKSASTSLMKSMSSYETELAKREIARETVKKEMDTWEPVVQEIRSAPQQIFSERPRGVEMKNAMRPKGFVPRTPLEKELFAALGQSEDVLNPNKDLTKAEEKALKAMSIHEAMARRAELMKHHELLSRAQIRAKRVKKIKSKRYRKILRKEKEGAERKELERLQTEDPEAFVERLEQLEKDRMEERLTLKHRGGGKFARLHKVYSKFDDKTRDAMQTMLQKSRELTKKTGTLSSSDEEEEELTQATTKTKASLGASAVAAAGDEDDDDGGDDNTKASCTRATHLEMLKAINKKAGGWLDGPKSTFVYTTGAVDISHQSTEQPMVVEEDDTDKDIAELSSKKKTEEKSTSSQPVQEPGSREAKQRKRKAKSMFEEDESKEVERIAAEPRAKKQKQKEESHLDIESDNDEIVSIASKDTRSGKPESAKHLSEKSIKKKRNKKKDKSNGEKGDDDKDKLTTSKPKTKPVVESVLEVPDDTTNNKDKEEDDEEDNTGDPLRVTMEELFQDEDVVEEFAREKAAAEEKARPKVEDTRLPGWGNWAGPDYKDKPPSKKHQRAAARRIKQMEKEKQKIQQPNVWLNPNRDDAIRKLQPKTLPFPFNSVQQYEASLRQPISRGFVRESAFKLLNKPEVVTKLGHIIKPLDKEEIFKKKAQQEKAIEIQGGADLGKDGSAKGRPAGKTSFAKRGGEAGKRKGKQKRRAIS